MSSAKRENTLSKLKRPRAPSPPHNSEAQAAARARCQRRELQLSQLTVHAAAFDNTPRVADLPSFVAAACHVLADHPVADVLQSALSLPRALAHAVRLASPQRFAVRGAAAGGADGESGVTDAMLITCLVHLARGAAVATPTNAGMGGGEGGGEGEAGGKEEDPEEGESGDNDAVTAKLKRLHNRSASTLPSAGKSTTITAENAADAEAGKPDAAAMTRRAARWAAKMIADLLAHAPHAYRFVAPRDVLDNATIVELCRRLRGSRVPDRVAGALVAYAFQDGNGDGDDDDKNGNNMRDGGDESGKSGRHVAAAVEELLLSGAANAHVPLCKSGDDDDDGGANDGVHSEAALRLDGIEINQLTDSKPRRTTAIDATKLPARVLGPLAALHDAHMQGEAVRRARAGVQATSSEQAARRHALALGEAATLDAGLHMRLQDGVLRALSNERDLFVPRCRSQGETDDEDSTRVWWWQVVALGIAAERLALSTTTTTIDPSPDALAARCWPPVRAAVRGLVIFTAAVARYGNMAAGCRAVCATRDALGLRDATAGGPGVYASLLAMRPLLLRAAWATGRFGAMQGRDAAADGAVADLAVALGVTRIRGVVADHEQERRARRKAVVSLLRTGARGGAARGAEREMGGGIVCELVAVALLGRLAGARADAVWETLGAGERAEWGRGAEFVGGFEREAATAARSSRG